MSGVVGCSLGQIRNSYPRGSCGEQGFVSVLSPSFSMDGVCFVGRGGKGVKSLVYFLEAPFDL